MPGIQAGHLVFTAPVGVSHHHGGVPAALGITCGRIYISHYIYAVRLIVHTLDIHFAGLVLFYCPLIDKAKAVGSKRGPSSPVTPYICALLFVVIMISVIRVNILVFIRSDLFGGDYGFAAVDDVCAGGEGVDALGAIQDLDAAEVIDIVKMLALRIGGLYARGVI